MDNLAAALALVPERSCVCIPESPEVTWAKGHARTSTNPQATLQSVAVKAYQKDAEAFITAARDGLLARVGDGIMSWLELVRHQEATGTAPPVIIKQLDAVAPGWRVSTLADLTIAASVLTDRNPQRWKQPWLSMTTAELREYRQSGQEWINGIRSMRDRLRGAGIGHILDEKFPKWDDGKTFIEIIQAREHAEKSVRRATAKAEQAAATATPPTDAETTLTAADRRFLAAARRGNLATTPFADTWHTALKRRNLAPAARIEVDEVLPGWAALSFGRLNRHMRLSAELASVWKKPWSTRLSDDAPSRLVDALADIQTFIGAANAGRLSRVPGALIRLRSLRALEAEGLLAEELTGVLDRVAPKWREDAPGALDKEWVSFRLDFAMFLAEQMLGYIKSGTFGGSKSATHWLADIRIAESRGRLPKAILVQLDELAPRWRELSPSDIDRVTHGLLAAEPIGDTETPANTEPEVVVADEVPTLVATPPREESLATVTAMPSSRGALVREVISLAQQLSGVVAQLDAEHPGWQSALDPRTLRLSPDSLV
ncbi:hypothetical protein GCM10025867_46040 (plasmid) [Frondihabitans sucicola]|uniref:Uncharacterized protein n=1 Tax=Frondihabitans sucicola TaxID=1268041 RepID=A0ABM8GV65_9MICO|nr:hypothetical protein [Frondihabitans sucicola]BDZ52363.1 hypothetical protein GCM10025867_46040 [Frondihabitans sucicola]